MSKKVDTARDALKELGISLDKTINWTKASKEQMNVIACTRSKNSSVENIEGDEDYVYIPVCGSIEIKTFLEVNREEMQLMWTTEKVEGANLLVCKHFPKLILEQYKKAITVPKIGELPQSKQQHTAP